METNQVNTTAEAVSVPASQPAPGAEEQKPIPATTEENVEQQPQETNEQQEERKQSKFQRRLDRQKSARVAAETETKILRERLEKLEGQAKPAQDASEPKRDDFPDYETYWLALAKHTAKQETSAALRADREARETRERQQQANAGTEKIAKAWAEREKTFQAATKDYEEVVSAFTEKGGEMDSLSNEARMAIAESEAGPALLYHLGKNPDEAERLADLSPRRQIAELGKLEAKISLPAKKTTNAPAPASTTTGGKTATKDLTRMNQEEYEAYRKTQGARWAR